MLATPLRILQANANRGISATESILEIGVQEKADVIVIQEPWLLHNRTTGYKDTRSIVHSAFSLMLPTPMNMQTRPRAATYISRTILVEANQVHGNDPDIQRIHIQDRVGTSFLLINVYNEQNQESEWTVARELYKSQEQLPQDVILLGDFNTRHPSWDLLGKDTSCRATDLAEWLEDNRFTLHNMAGVGTFYRPNMMSKSVLDLTLSRGFPARHIQNWRTIETGSDHVAICFDVQAKGNHILPESRLSFNTARADWDHFKVELEIQALSIPLDNDLDSMAQTFSDAILAAALAAIPKNKVTTHSKP
jgi:endonuclease/exonuclease/phosphatase family metal-dependent hydrolase